MDTYKIYRWAYHDQVEQITVPNNTTFHVLDSFDNFKETEYGSVNQNTYIALILYTKENWDILKKSKKQTLALDCYDISDKWIVIILKDVCKIDDGFPLSENKFEFPECYLKIRATKQVRTDEKSLEEIVKMSKSEQDDYFRPIISYIKIHGFSKEHYGKLDVTRVDVGSWLDNRNVLNVEREEETISEALGYNKYIKTDKSDEQEFLSALFKVYNLMK